MIVATNPSVTGRMLRLKRERKALILAHNYQQGQVQNIADYVGDSLELSQIAAGSTVVAFRRSGRASP